MFLHQRPTFFSRLLASLRISVIPLISLECVDIFVILFVLSTQFQMMHKAALSCSSAHESVALNLREEVFAVLNAVCGVL